MQNLLFFLIAFILFPAGLVVYPFLKTERFRVTPSKVAALVIVLGICAYRRNVMFLVIFLWPLSLIWFPEYWGSCTRFLRGPYIDEKSPPIVVSLMGWFLLVVFPLLLLWLGSR